MKLRTLDNFALLKQAVPDDDMRTELNRRVYRLTTIVQNAEGAWRKTQMRGSNNMWWTNPVCGCRHIVLKNKPRHRKHLDGCLFLDEV